MRRVLVVARYSLIFALIGLSVCLAQEPNKKGKDAKEEMLDRLHSAPVAALAPLGIKLLAGYEHKAATDFEGNQVGQIWKNKGVKIRYEIGRSQGHAVDADMKNNYVWYREQVVHGRKIKIALNRENILLITIPLDEGSWYAANFYGEIKKPEDMVDMTLMVLTFEQ